MNFRENRLKNTLHNEIIKAQSRKNTTCFVFDEKELTMKKLLALLLSFALCLSFSLPGFAAQTEYDGYILCIREDVLQSQSLNPQGLRPLGDGLYHAARYADAAALLNAGIVEYIEPNNIMSLQAYQPLWNMDAINAPAAWSHTDSEGAFDLRGKGVTVAVIDSGVYAEHPDLKDAHILNTLDLTGEGIQADTPHGTQVAGLLAAGLNNGIGVDGAAPEVSILPIRITIDGKTTNALIIEAIHKAVALGADVINLSVGGKINSSALRQACDEAAAAGAIVVAAAGNYEEGDEKSETNHVYPASYESTVSVSACTKTIDGVVFDHSYSYFNNKVSVSAPGTNIRSLSTSGGTSTANGTSFAAPHVSALAALAKQRSETADLDVFLCLLEASSLDLGQTGRDDYYGYGLIDMAAFAALIADEHSITYHLGEEGAHFPEDASVPRTYYFSSEECILPTPVKEGYLFLGWYDNPELQGKVIKTIPANSFDDKDYYAAWEKVSEVIHADDLNASLQTGQGLHIHFPQGKVELSHEAVVFLSSLGRDSIAATLRTTDAGVSLTFGANGEAFELKAPLLLTVKDPGGIPFYGDNAVSMSARIEDEMHMLLPGSGEVAFRPVESSFPDLNNHWGRESALFAADRGIFLGDGVNFMPDQPLTRAMFATVLGRVYAGSFGSIETENAASFQDCDDSSWYGPYVNWCSEAGIVQGDGKGNFHPNDPITRAEMATMIQRFAVYLGLDTSLRPAHDFADREAIPSWAVEAAQFCLAAGIMSGVGENTFAPMLDASRVQCAAVLHRLTLYALR